VLKIARIIESYNSAAYPTSRRINSAGLDDIKKVSVFLRKNTGELRFVVRKKNGGPQQDPRSYGNHG
jgi:hypothetical protein